MDGQRFDELTRSVAAGTSRRRVLRLAGGGLAAALLGVLGRGDQVAAAVVFGHCVSYGETGGPPLFSGEPGEGEVVSMGRPCPACAHIEGAFCAVVLNPGGELQCRCIRA
jgi:hypothetical protein